MHLHSKNVCARVFENMLYLVPMVLVPWYTKARKTSLKSPPHAAPTPAKPDSPSRDYYRRLSGHRSRSRFGLSRARMSRRHCRENDIRAPDSPGNYLHRLLGNRNEISKRESVTGGGRFTKRGRVRSSRRANGETFWTS